MKSVKQISKFLLLAGAVSVISGCQNKNGLLGSENWNRNGYSNYLLNGARGASFYNMNGGQAVAYLVYNQSNTPSTGSGVYNPQAGQVQTSTDSAGNIAGGTVTGTAANNCLLKIISVTPSGYYNGTTQNFAPTYYNTGFPTGGQTAYPTGAKLPVPCDKDSEVAATANAFYSTGGKNSQYLYAYRVDTNGATYGPPQAILVGPNTRIAAASSGHIAVITNNGATLTLLYEDRIGGDGGWIADKYRDISFPGIVQDVEIDMKQGVVYVGVAHKDGTGQVFVYDIHELYGMLGTQRSVDYRAYTNFVNNFPMETQAYFMFRNEIPLKLKTFDGLTGVFTSSGRPKFLKANLAHSSNALSQAKTPEELADAMADRQTDVEMTDIMFFDPLQNSSTHYNFKDLTVGDNLAYMITSSGTVSIFYINETYPYGGSPWVNNLNMGQALNTVERSPDGSFVILTGSRGISIGRISGNTLLFNTVGRPDIEESGGVISAAALGKVEKIVQTNQAPAATAPANTTSGQNQ